ncbi:MAG: sigma-70 family RNA polymerase sigma factor [Gammaproteobacteria bacterium]
MKGQDNQASDDDALMAGVGARDPAAFAELVRRHLDAVHGYLYRLCGSRDDADDLAQDTFLRVWARAETWRPGAVRVTTWLHRIAHNIWVDTRRRARSMPLEDPEGVLDPAPGADAGLREQRALTQVDHALRALPTAQRAAILLAEVRGFSNPDIAAVLGTSVRAVESLLGRARRQLRDLLEET